MVDKQLYETIKEKMRRDRTRQLANIIKFLPDEDTRTVDEMFPADSEERKVLERIAEKNRLQRQEETEQIMKDSGSATALIALLKLDLTDEEREKLNTPKPKANKEAKDGGLNVTQIEIEAYADKVRATLKSVNRYSPTMDAEVAALASAWATLHAANNCISKLAVPFMEETTTQGTKVIVHPAFALQQKALESMSKHTKLLGLDFENAPDMATEGPLTELTKEMISYTKTQEGHISVAKAEKTKKKKGSKK